MPALKQREFAKNFEHFMEIADLGLDYYMTRGDIDNYNGPVDRLEKVEILSKVSPSNLEDGGIFLAHWGNLKAYGGEQRWHRFIEKVFQTDVPAKVEPFRHVNLWDTNYQFEKSKVWLCYNAFWMNGKKIKDAGTTAIMKTLHWIAPSFFIPWDSNIRTVFDLSDDVNGCIWFHEFIRNKLIQDANFRDEAIALKKKYQVSPLYAIDKFLWIICTKKKEIFLGNPRSELKWW